MVSKEAEEIGRGSKLRDKNCQERAFSYKRGNREQEDRGGNNKQEESSWWPGVTCNGG